MLYFIYFTSPYATNDYLQYLTNGLNTTFRIPSWNYTFSRATQPRVVTWVRTLKQSWSQGLARRQITWGSDPKEQEWETVKRKWEKNGWAAPHRPSACLASRPKTEDRVSRRESNSLMDEEAYLSEARSWSTAPCAPWSAGRTRRQSLLLPGEERFISYKGNWFQLGPLVTRETSRGASPSPGLWWEQSPAGAWGKYKRSVICTGQR